jgi:hypothetical protein
MAHGELWIDLAGARERLAGLGLAAELSADLGHFIDEGYVIFPGAIDPALADRITADTLGLLAHPERCILKNKGRYVDAGGLESLGIGDRIVDLYAVSAAAREAIFCPRLAAFLRAVFGEPAIAMQSISFERGSQQAMHQDTAYVISERPLALAASWIALEDVAKGAGELIYYPGSHRFEHFLFSGESKGWQKARDGVEQHQRFLAQLHEQATARGLRRERFLARKGDVLVWHADLAHGGARIQLDATRRSLVTHYVPLGVKPRYRMHLGPAYAELPGAGGHFFTSRHYDLRGGATDARAKILYDGGVSRARAARPRP